MQRSHALYKDKRTFKVVEHLSCRQVESVHDVSKLVKHKKILQAAATQSEADRWYCKRHPSLRKAVLEVTAQELFRFISSSHPKTRVAERIVNGVTEYYVISKEIKNSTALSSDDIGWLKTKLQTGGLPGLGVISVLSLFVNETDLRLHNIHRLPSGEIVKIDGDACFKRLLENGTIEDFPIPPSSINRLPFIAYGYPAHNFFDVVQGGKRCQSNLFDSNSSHLPNYRREINETLLKILCLPTTFFTSFAACYTDDQDLITEIAQEFARCLIELKTAAFCSSSFNEYLLSAEASAHLQTFLTESQSFKAIGKTPVFTADLVKDVQAAFECMRNEGETFISAQSANEISFESSSGTEDANEQLTQSNSASNFNLFLQEFSVLKQNEEANSASNPPSCHSGTTFQSSYNKNHFFNEPEDSQSSSEKRSFSRKRKGFDS